MTTNRKIFRLIIVILIILLLFPIVLNWIILQAPLFPIVGEGKDWLGFWATYIGAIASFAMVVLTWWTLKQSKIQNDALIEQNKEILRNNKEQLDEQRRQWEENNRPNICINVIVYNKAFFLQIANVGNVDATNVRLKFNQEFILSVKSHIQPYYNAINDSSFFVERGNKRYMYIGWCEEINESWKGKDFSIVVQGTYNDKYTVAVTIPISDFVGKGFFVVLSETDRLLEQIKNGTVVQNNQHYPIQRSLDIIAKELVQIKIRMPEVEPENNG